jgi:large subunit ribosomal protein L30
MTTLAIIRIRGTAGVRKDIADTLLMLNMKGKNECVLLTNSSTNIGMLKKIKDYVTWGEITPEVQQKLTAKRGEKKIIDGKEVMSKVFRLHPPRGGFERKGIKKDYVVGGALGYRGEDINRLIECML